MSAVIIDGGVVHYEYLGRGRPVIFIHGWVGSWRYWVPAMTALAATHRAYAVDLWGYGDSDKLRLRYTWPGYLRLLLAFMAELGIDRAPLVVGHALGALVALTLARAHAGIMERLALVSLPLQRADVNARALAGGRPAPRAGIFGSDGAAEPVSREMEKTDAQAIAESLALLSGMDVPAELAALQVPTLLLHGVRDELVHYVPAAFPSGPQRVTAATPVVRPISFPQAHHFPMLEEGSAFNRLLRDFLLLDVSAPGALASLELKEEWRRKVRQG